MMDLAGNKMHLFLAAFGIWYDKKLLVGFVVGTERVEFRQRMSDKKVTS